MMSALPPQTEGCNRIGAGRCPLSCYTTCVSRRTTSKKLERAPFPPQNLRPLRPALSTPPMLIEEQHHQVVGDSTWHWPLASTPHLPSTI